MGFTFGLINVVDAEVGVVSFVIMIFFLIFFENLTGLIEWTLEESPVYNNMLQKIYKEIMLMGVVSFAIGMYETTSQSHSPKNAEWIVGIDFAHYVLFYLAFFFVIHAFYLIIISILGAKDNDKVYALTIHEVRDMLPQDASWWTKFIFNYSPISAIRDKFEFKIYHVLFRDTYKWVTSDFDFANYLSGCMQQYALRIMSTGFISWLILLVLIILNYLKIKLGKSGYLNCGGYKYDKVHHYYNETVHYEVTSSSSSSSEANVSDYCARQSLKMFFLCGICLSIVTLIFLFFSHYYRKALIHRTGCDSPADYSIFLAMEEETLSVEAKETRRRTQSASSSTMDASTPTGSFRTGGSEMVKRRLSNTGISTGSSRPKQRRMSVGSSLKAVGMMKKETKSQEEMVFEALSHGCSRCFRCLVSFSDAILERLQLIYLYFFNRESYLRLHERLHGSPAIVSPSPARLSPVPAVEPVLINAQRHKSVVPTDGNEKTENIASRLRKSMFKPRSTVFPLQAANPEENSGTISRVSAMLINN